MKKPMPIKEHYEVNAIAKIVCAYYGQNVDNLKIRVKKHHIVHTRHIYHYICHKVMGYSTYKTAIKSERDHVTVLHSCRQIENWMSYDDEVKRDVEIISDMVKDKIQHYKQNLNLYYEIGSMIDQVPYEKLPLIKKEIEKYIIA
jgi:hypothetical protein